MILCDSDFMILRLYEFFYVYFTVFYFFNAWKLTSISIYIYIAIFIVDGYFISCKSTINKE